MRSCKTLADSSDLLYVVTTDNGKVTDTYSWGNNMEGRWFHNDPLDIAVAQKAIDSGIGIDRYGGGRP